MHFTKLMSQKNGWRCKYIIYVVNCEKDTQHHDKFDGENIHSKLEQNAKIYMVNCKRYKNIHVKLNCKTGTQYYGSEEQRWWDPHFGLPRIFLHFYSKILEIRNIYACGEVLANEPDFLMEH